MTNFGDDGHFGNSGSARSAGSSSSDPGGGVAVAPALGPEQIRDLLSGKFVCPFCGSINESEQGVCPRCTMENSPASRKATKSRIGPWYVLQTRNPAAPGMKFETLLNFARKGRVKPRSIVRGPTTHQLWKFAAQVKGLSRELGVCYSCGGAIEANTSLCPQCNRLQDPPANPDVLLETKDAPAPPIAPRPGRNREPDLAEVDAEFVIPALGGAASDDSVAGVSLTGSMAGVAFDPAAGARSEAPTAPPMPASSPAPVTFPPATRNNNKKDEGFLSPKDLAAAFKLNFSPTAEPEAAGQPRSASAERRRTPRGPMDSRPGLNGVERRQPRDPQRPLQHPLDFQPRRAVVEPPDVLAAPTYDPALDEALALTRPARKPVAKNQPAQPRRRRFRLLKVLVFLIVFGGGLYAAAMYLDPTLRQQSLQYYNQGKTAVLQALNRSQPNTEPTAPVPDNPAPPDSTNTADVTDPGSSAAPPAPSSITNPDASSPAAPDHSNDAQPASASTGTPTSQPVTLLSATPLPATRPAIDPTVAPSVPPPSATRPPVVPVPATPAAVPPAAAPASPVTPAAIADARPAVPTTPPQPVIDPASASLKLYREAMSVAASDPAKAIARYKAIKKFPQEDWPSDLDVRIHLAEQQLKAH